MTVKKTAIYLRLSLSDGDLGEDSKDESNSIENQRLLIEEYLENHEDISKDIVEYVDDGYTGTNFNRPDFKRMLEEAKAGKIATIIVKDMSRLGRDYIEVGDYVEQIFPVLGIRFIAVNNNFDSDAYGGDFGMDMAVTNLVNHLYSRDISKKVRSAMEVRWKQGYATNGRAPYGYKVNPDEKGRWLVDPETAPVVKDIFDMACNGYKVNRIVTELNAKGIPTPGVMCRQNDYWRSDRYMVPEEERLWEYIMVHRILKNYAYTGACVQGKRKKLTLGSTSFRNVPEDQQVIVENVNEPIVSKEEFELAQAIFKPMKKGYCTSSKYPLQGICRCGTCKTALIRGYRADGDILYCNHSRSKGKTSSCCKDSYSVQAIEGIVSSAVRNMIYKLQFIYRNMEAQTNGTREADGLCADKGILQGRIDVLNAEKIRAYENYADGNISREQYLKSKEELTEEITKFQEKISKQEQLEEFTNSAIKGVKILSDTGDIFLKNGITKEVIDTFIDKVYIYDSNSVEIVFKCEDEIKRALEFLQKSA